MKLEEAIDKALDERAGEWYLHNEETDTTTIIQTRLVEIAADAARKFLIGMFAGAIQS